jgi:hypothetical protein
MKRTRPYIFFFFSGIFLWGVIPLAAQDDGGPQILQTQERSGYMMAHTRGMGFGYQQGKILSIHSTLFWQAEFATMRHPKEYRRTNESFPNTKTYSYGKLNRVYMLRGGLGVHRTLAEKPYWGGVTVKYTLFGGLNLAVAEPIYLYILYYNLSDSKFYRSLERYDPDNHFSDNIYGRGPVGKGLKEAKLYPGISLKGSFFFEYGSDRDYLRGLEVGAALDAFPKKIPIMALIDNPHAYLTFYLALHAGNKK